MSPNYKRYQEETRITPKRADPCRSWTQSSRRLASSWSPRYVAPEFSPSPVHAYVVPVPANDRLPLRLWLLSGLPVWQGSDAASWSTFLAHVEVQLGIAAKALLWFLWKRVCSVRGRGRIRGYEISSLARLRLFLTTQPPSSSPSASSAVIRESSTSS